MRDTGVGPVGVEIGAGSVRARPVLLDARIPALSVVLPAYDEEQVLPLALSEAVEALRRQCADWELIVVDDGSTDRTPEIVADWSAREPRVRLVRNAANRGYSQTLARGFDEARYDAVFYTDADAQFDLEEIERLFVHLGDVDMVVGYRAPRRDAAVRRFASWVYNRLLGLVLGLRVRDVNCAFKLFTREFLDRVKIQSTGFLVDAELFARAARAGLTWREVPVRHRPRTQGDSTVNLSAVPHTLRGLWRLRRSLR